jgi:hypothetical protein
MVKTMIDKMVDRFLGWKLPKDFGPDAGISFTPTKPHDGDELGNSWWPVGTNLLTADQARQMFEHCMDEEPCTSQQPGQHAALPPHQQRVFAEKEELDDKLTKLKAFFGTEIFAGLDDAEMDRLQRQADHMGAYSDVLGERIAAF